MRKELLIAVCAVGLFLPPFSSAESFLVENGVPKAEIVIAEDAVPLVRVAAEFLQTDVEKMTGAKLPIQTKPSDGETIQVFVGHSSFTDKRGLDVSDLGHGGYHLKSGDGWLALLGRDQTFLSQRYESARELFKLLLHKRGSEERTKLWELWYEKTGEAWGLPYATFSKTWNKELEISDLDEQGTFNAVAGFLRGLGVRHYIPGPLGEVIPKRASIALPQVDETVRPDFPIRWANQLGHHFRSSDIDEKYPACLFPQTV